MTNPCTPDCPDRKPFCHNGTCPHGWAIYEEEYKELQALIHDESNANRYEIRSFKTRRKK